MWHCHHRAEILPCGRFSSKVLKKFHLYYNQPADRPIFLPQSEHIRLHSVGRKHSAAAKEKIAKANIGKRASESTRRKMSETRKGKPKSAEMRRKTSMWQKGRHRSKETCQKMSKARTGCRWWNNGIINVVCRECPEGFVAGFLKTCNYDR